MLINAPTIVIQDLNTENEAEIQMKNWQKFTVVQLKVNLMYKNW